MQSWRPLAANDNADLGDARPSSLISLEAPLGLLFTLSEWELAVRAVQRLVEEGALPR